MRETRGSERIDGVAAVGVVAVGGGYTAKIEA